MLFNSVPFVIFFVVFFLLYWQVFASNLKAQNLLLLAGSYFFYAWWDWHFLALIIAFSLFNFRLGHYIYKADKFKIKRNLAALGTIVGLGLLFYFKYTNFFLLSVADGLGKLNIHFNVTVLNLILPLGISFYTFRTLSYIYDIKNDKLKPTTDWVAFFSFVAFFPCLLSGPVDRARNLIPQIEKPRKFNYDTATDGLRQILCGLFKKMIIADNLASVTEYIFGNYRTFPGSTMFIGSLYYFLQIYTDFSGYSDMAIGLAKLLGFDVARNFNYPIFSQNIADYWNRWHMSLTSWLTEYLFTPLSISLRDFGKPGLIMAIIINLTLIGMWHGANWTFVVFGLMHGCYFIPLVIKGTFNKRKKMDPNKLLPTLSEFKNICVTFILVSLALVVFRADNLTEAFITLGHIFSPSIIANPIGAQLHVIPFLLLFLLIEWLQRGKAFTLQIDFIRNRFIRAGIYYGLLLCFFFYIQSHITQFIYFKF